MARKIYLIDPKFQLRFSIYVCLIVSLSALIYPLAIYDMMNHFIEFTSTNFPKMVSKYTDQRESLIVFLAIWQIAFTAVIFVLSIFFSHKIAGPVYKIKQYCKAIQNDETVDDLRLRKHDYFKDLAHELNLTFKALKSKNDDKAA